MAISDKTRKLLWGQSGNMCAICRKKLTIDATESDDISIVGEECHINSGQKNGPRFEESIPSDKIDVYENLVLLCRIHHKMIDDQYETYTPSLLMEIKSNHEKWVLKKLSESDEEKPVKVKRIKENIPEFLNKISMGKELLNIISNGCGFNFDYDEPNNEKEIELISNFLQLTQDAMDIYLDLEVSGKVRLAQDLNNEIKDLEENGYYIFTAKEEQVLEGGGYQPSSWPIFHIHILKKTNKNIIKI